MSVGVPVRMEMAKYKTVVGLDYSGKRVEADEIVDDLPAKSIKWLREQGLIVLISGTEVEETVEETPVVETPEEE
jgi:hypothetical protein